MASQPTRQSADLQSPAKSRADDRADIARVLLALGLLAFLASFDRAGSRSPTPASPSIKVLGDSR